MWHLLGIIACIFVFIRAVSIALIWPLKSQCYADNQISKHISITITRLYNFDPLKPHFYTVKLRFTGVYIIFLVSAQKHRLLVLVRTASPRRFLRVPTIYVLKRNMKKYQIFFYLNLSWSQSRVLAQFINLYILFCFTAASVKCRVAAIKCLLALHHSANYILTIIGIIEFIWTSWSSTKAHVRGVYSP